MELVDETDVVPTIADKYWEYTRYPRYLRFVQDNIRDFLDIYQDYIDEFNLLEVRDRFYQQLLEQLTDEDIKLLMVGEDL